MISIMMVHAASGETVSVSSPDSRIEVKIIHAGKIYFSVQYDAAYLINQSPVTMTLSNGLTLGSTQPISTKTGRVSREIKTLRGSRNVIKDEYNELTFDFKDNYSLLIRVIGARCHEVVAGYAERRKMWITPSCATLARGYPASGGYVAYQYEFLSSERKMVFDITGNAASMDFHILLPKDINTVNKILSNGKTVAYTYSSIENSKYVDFTSVVKGVQHIEIFYENTALNSESKKVTIRRKSPEAFELTVGGQPTFIKGAVGNNRIDLVKKYGGNGIRAGYDKENLDEAWKLGLKVLVNLPVAAQRDGFDYTLGIASRINRFWLWR